MLVFLTTSFCLRSPKQYMQTMTIKTTCLGGVLSNVYKNTHTKAVFCGVLKNVSKKPFIGKLVFGELYPQTPPKKIMKTKNKHMPTINTLKTHVLMNHFVCFP